MKLSNPKVCYLHKILSVLRVLFTNLHKYQYHQPTAALVFLSLGENREMKGSDCRKNIILVAIAMKEKDLDVGAGHRIYKLLLSLIELQKLAYAPASQRDHRSILRALNQSYLFGELLTSLAHDPKKATERSVFGMPFHCIVCHLAEQLRLISGRSLVAEHAERYFNKLR